MLLLLRDGPVLASIRVFVPLLGRSHFRITHMSPYVSDWEGYLFHIVRLSIHNVNPISEDDRFSQCEIACHIVTSDVPLRKSVASPWPQRQVHSMYRHANTACQILNTK